MNPGGAIFDIDPIGQPEYVFAIAASVCPWSAQHVQPVIGFLLLVLVECRLAFNHMPSAFFITDGILGMFLRPIFRTAFIAETILESLGFIRGGNSLRSLVPAYCMVIVSSSLFSLTA